MLVANILGNWTDPGKVTLYSITDCMGQAEQDVTEEITIRMPPCPMISRL
jgi:hypothetical protein